MTPTLWLLLALVVAFSIALGVLTLRDRGRKLFAEPPFRTVDGYIIERQTSALRREASRRECRRLHSPRSVR